jgi:hypothetical protein
VEEAKVVDLEGGREGLECKLPSTGTCRLLP